MIPVASKQQSMKLLATTVTKKLDHYTAHVAFVFTRYMLMSVAKRNDEDERTLGELFFYFVDEVADITFKQSLSILMTAMLESIQVIFHATDEQITQFMKNFVARLPEYMQKPLLAAQEG